MSSRLSGIKLPSSSTWTGEPGAIQKPSGPVGGVAGDPGQKLSESRRPDMAANRVARGLSGVDYRIAV
jgi:hypothetical protein